MDNQKNDLWKQDINLTDYLLFLSVMKNRDAYTNVLNIIMGRDDIVLKDIKVEEIILNEQGKRAIRLDAWALDVEDIQYAIEMQNDTDTDCMPKRSRFYQGLMDTPILKSGKKTKYKYLPRTYIIFITEADLFGYDQACYVFKNRCTELPQLTLGDETVKIFLNTTSKNGNPELVSLLQYMKNTTLDNPEIVVRDKRLIRLDEIVTETKQSEEWEEHSMGVIEQCWQYGVAHGIEEGRLQSIIQLVQKKIHKGLSPEEIADLLEEDFELVNKICGLLTESPESTVEDICLKLLVSEN